ncbi:MAG: hypothetical protein ACO4AI_03230, partial [Prochlorothrix sp.]
HGSVTDSVVNVDGVSPGTKNEALLNRGMNLQMKDLLQQGLQQLRLLPFIPYFSNAKNLARVRALRALDIRGETDRSDGITGEAAGVSIDRHWCETSASKSRRRCWRAASSGSGGVGAGEGKRGVTGERGK